MLAVALEELKERRQGQAHFLVFLRQSHSGLGRPGTEAALYLSILSAGIAGVSLCPALDSAELKFGRSVSCDGRFKGVRTQTLYENFSQMEHSTESRM